MDTVQGAIHSVEERVLGIPQDPGHQEPISGVEGAGTATEPYDSGNATEQPGNALQGYNEDSAAPIAAKPSDNLSRAASGQEKSTSTESTAIGSSQNQSNGQNEDYSQSSSSTQRDEPVPSSTPEQSETVVKPDEDVPPPSSSDTREGGPKSETLESAPGPQSTDESVNKQAEPIPHEKTYRSSGFAAEGGDFDAKKSGAGKEADRLLSERGPEAEVRGSIDESNALQEPHSGGIWKGGHKSGFSMSKAKDKLHLGKQ